VKILLLNQAFHPDVVSTAQHASDLALTLREVGHDVTVIAGSHGYDNPNLRFPHRETWRGISIHRVSTLRLGKSSRWRRAAAFAAYLANCFFRTLTVGSQDVVIALTSPPLISALGALLVRLKGGKFVFWVMDLNPDEAIAAGWLRVDSTPGRLLQAVLRFSLDNSDRVIALDRFMARRLRAKGVPESKISVIPPWSHDQAVAYDLAGRQAFRGEHGLDGKFVVMYSGNHSPCHPLDTLLGAALALRDRPAIAFCFVGGGAEFPKVQAFAETHRLANVLCLPYQPLEKLSASLSAADLHVVAMGDPFVGIVHPCKVYNIRSLGIPFLYIGPSPSHVTELDPAGSFRHGDHAGVTDLIRRAACVPRRQGVIPLPASGALRFSGKLLLPELVNTIEATVTPRRARAAKAS
jgi:glycosyltransferase involved in cell wall biosynthesis